MEALERFIAQQRSLEEGAAQKLFSSLEPKGLLTIERIVRGHKELRRWHTWIDAERFARRLNAALIWLESVQSGPNIRGLSNVPFFFFQPPDSLLDATNRQKVKGKLLDVSHTELFDDDLPLDAAYLHVNTNFSQLLMCWEYGNWRISPRLHFTNAGATQRPFHPWANCSVVGWTLPNYAELLGVNAAIATEYLARIVIHDIGHCWLPKICIEQETLHDVVMITASGAYQDHHIVPSTQWERFVLDECTYPHFSLFAEQRIENLQKSTHAMPKFRQHYLRRILELANGRWSLEKTFRIPNTPSIAIRTHAVDAIVKTLAATGFRNYEATPRSHTS